MDVASFIPGVVHTADFMPGPTTPAPYTGPHVGLLDGARPDLASVNVAEIYNRILLAIAGQISDSGMTYQPDNWTQLGLSIKKMVNDVIAGSPIGGLMAARVILDNLHMAGQPIILSSWGITLVTRVGDLFQPAFDVAFFPSMPNLNYIVAISTIDLVPSEGGGRPGYCYVTMNKTVTGFRFAIFDNDPGGWAYSPKGLNLSVFA